MGWIDVWGEERRGEERRVGKESTSTSCEDLSQQEDERIHANDNTNAIQSHWNKRTRVQAWDN